MAWFSPRVQNASGHLIWRWHWLIAVIRRTTIAHYQNILVRDWVKKGAG